MGEMPSGRVVLYVDPDWLDDPDGYDGPDVDTADQPDFASGIAAVAVASDLRRFALTTASQGNTQSGQLCVFDVADGTWHWGELEERARFVGDGEQVAFSPDGSLVAVAASTDLRTIVWRSDGMSMVWSAGADAGWGPQPRPGDPGGVQPCGLFTHVEFSGDGRLVVAVGGNPWEPAPVDAPDERVVVADAATGEVVFAETVPIRGGALLDHSGTTLAYVGADDEVLVRDLASGSVTRLPGQVRDARVLAYSPDGDAVAVGGDDVVQVIRRGGARRSIAGSWHVARWSRDGLRVLTGDGERATVLDDDGRTLWTRPMENLDDLAAAFTPDGRALVTVDSDTTEVVAWHLGA